MSRFVLDSDTVSYILQERRTVLARLAGAVEDNAEIFLCPMVYYQVRRGLLYKEAPRQLREFDSLVRGFTWVDFEQPMWDRAAEAWASTRRRGRPHDDDADLLITAYARRLRAILVTNNASDFAGLGVQTVNWVA